MLKKDIQKARLLLRRYANFKPSRKAKLHGHDPASFFKDFDKVGAALLESLIENDTDAFIEILDRTTASQSGSGGKRGENVPLYRAACIIKKGESNPKDHRENSPWVCSHINKRLVGVRVAFPAFPISDLFPPCGIVHSNYFYGTA